MNLAKLLPKLLLIANVAVVVTLLPEMLSVSDKTAGNALFA
jgi:hypothetical protein